MLENDIEIHYVMKDSYAVRIPQMVSIDKRAARFPWVQDEFLETLSKMGSHAIVAEVGDKVAGYIVYETHPDYLEMLKMSVDPNFRHEGIEEKMLDSMVAKLKRGDRTRIIFHVNEHDTEMQVMLRDKYGFHADKVERKYFENGDDAYSMRYQMLPVAELLRHMNRKLTDLTGMEWQVVKPVEDVRDDIKDEDKKYFATRIDNNINSPDGIAFRTSGKVKDPKAAFTAITHYFDLEPSPAYLESLNKAKKITVPASWVKQRHLHKGAVDALTEHFSPVDFQSRFHKDNRDGDDRHQRG